MMTASLVRWWRAWAGRRDAVIALLVVCPLVVGCASSGERSPAQAPGFAPQAGPHITRVAPGSFDLADVAPTGRPAVQVRLETPTQVGEAGGFGIGGGAGRAAGATALGLAALATAVLFPPAAIGNLPLLVISGPFIIAAGVQYEANAKRVSSVLAAFDLPVRLQANLVERLAEARPDPAESRIVIEVSVAGYGFMAPTVESASGITCFVFAADVAVRDGERTVFSDQIFEEPFRRSLDLPPPRCASLAELAKDEGRPAREILEESSHVIAAAIAKRLKVRR